MSETALCRNRLKHFCVGNGIDIGYGGDPIVPTAITIDIVTPYTHLGNHPQNLMGDGQDLYWFQDFSLDYVYSSHLLEDFENTEKVLREWLRVLKYNGYMVLYCPVEKKYREHCSKTGQTYNLFHKHENFDMNYVKEILCKIGDLRFIIQNELVDTYSFELVVQKGVTGII
jgi:predicted SAM-dependent methyltransferase